MGRVVNLVFLVLGLVGLAVLVAHVGPARLAANVAHVGWAFPAMLVLHLLGLVCDGELLRLFAADGGPRPRPWAFLRASLAGHAINTATPIGQLGEITKYTMLVQHLPGEQVAAGLLVGNVLRFVIGCAMYAVALPFALVAMGAEGATATLLFVAAAIFGVLALGTIAIVALSAHHLPFELPFDLARRLGVSVVRVEHARHAWQEVERLARRSLARPGDLLRGVAWAVGSIGSGIAGNAVLLIALGQSDAVALAVLAGGNNTIVAWATAFVPLQAGTAEGGVYLLFRGLGVAPEPGVLMELVKKVRRVVFVLVGMVVLGGDTFKQYWAGRAGHSPAAGHSQ